VIHRVNRRHAAGERLAEADPAPLVQGEPVPGQEVGLRVDQTLTQDAIGTMVMLELDVLGLDRVRTEASVQYVDHNLLQTDERNMADHPVPALRLHALRAVVLQARQRGVPSDAHAALRGCPGSC
jgi:hypothetical protein